MCLVFEARILPDRECRLNCRHANVVDALDDPEVGAIRTLSECYVAIRALLVLVLRRASLLCAEVVITPHT